VRAAGLLGSGHEALTLQEFLQIHGQVGAGAFCGGPRLRTLCTPAVQRAGRLGGSIGGGRSVPLRAGARAARMTGGRRTLASAPPLPHPTHPPRPAPRGPRRGPQGGPLSEGLDAAAAAAGLAAHSSTRVLEPGTVIYDFDDDPSEVYLVLSGVVDVTVKNFSAAASPDDPDAHKPLAGGAGAGAGPPPPAERHVGCGAGAVFGGTDFVLQRPRSFRAVAAARSSVVVVGRDAYRRLAAASPQAASYLQARAPAPPSLAALAPASRGAGGAKAGTRRLVPLGPLAEPGTPGSPLPHVPPRATPPRQRCHHYRCRRLRSSCCGTARCPRCTRTRCWSAPS
jgi:hypothetical protein